MTDCGLLGVRSQDAAFPPRFEDLPALRELSLRQLHLLEAAPPVTGLLALRRISLEVSDPVCCCSRP